MTQEQLKAWTELYDAALTFMAIDRDSPEYGPAEDRLTDALDTSIDMLTAAVVASIQ